MVTIYALVASCKASNPTPEEGDYGNVSITSFSLKDNAKILDNLDSIYFSINLIDGTVYNADSLPAGTDVSHLVVKIGTPTVNDCLITYRLPGTMRDTTISHIAAPNDSINFTGPVTVKIVSFNREYQRRYRVNVNVHRIHPDSLIWDEPTTGPLSLPTNLTKIESSKTISHQGKALCLTTGEGKACLGIASDPATNNWVKTSITLPQGAKTESFNSLDDRLYIIANDDLLYSSEDMGKTWKVTGAEMQYIYGSTGEALVGVKKDSDGKLWHVTYPATIATEVNGECPVSETGDLVTFVTQWSKEPVSIFLGGKRQDGTLSGDAWGYDGMVWEKLSQSSVAPVAGVSLIPYYTFKVNNRHWNATKESILLALGGRNSQNENRREVSVSYDCGIHWQAADSLLNIPEFIPAFSNAQALIFDREISSRIIKPITEWQAPYIYLYGGKDEEGNALGSWWRGVISRLTFKPLY